MIVVVSSTIFPPPNISESDPRSIFNSFERLEQTKETIASLLRCGYESIIIADNSGSRWVSGTEDALLPAKVIVYSQHQFQNKGISETIMLLSVLEQLPDNEPIIKISGRYNLNRNLDEEISGFDIAARIDNHPYKFGKRINLMSTRCYIIKNKAIFLSFLNSLIEEIYSYSSRIVGYGSFKRFILNQISAVNSNYSYFDPKLSVEAAGYFVVMKYKYKVNYLSHIGLCGKAGTFKGLVIEE